MQKTETAITTIKISRRLMVHIQENSKPGESVGETICRMRNLEVKGRPKKRTALPPATTIKIPRVVMNDILVHAKPKESRDVTLGRLLGLEQNGGNVRMDDEG